MRGKMKFKIGQQIIKKIRMKTKFIDVNNITPISLSNNKDYPQFCLNASFNNEMFFNFRQNSCYQQILEHITYPLGLKYLNEIKKLNPSLLDEKNIQEFKKNDNIGSPVLFEYNDINISGTTLRYIHVLAQIIKLFGSLNAQNICEIGVGYGGQCRILSSYFNINSYTLVDLKPVLLLAQKYLDNYPLKTCISYKTMNELPVEKQYDFVISNYTFSEISREFQEIYMHKIIKNSKSGFMIMNQITDKSYNSYTKDELLAQIPNNPEIIEEVPLTHPDNYILVWGQTLTSQE